MIKKALVATALFSGCTTSYHPRNFTGGYTDAVLGEDRFRVTCEGTIATDKQWVADCLMYRCAEVTMQAGDKYFTIVTSSGFGHGKLDPLGSGAGRSREIVGSNTEGVEERYHGTTTANTLYCSAEIRCYREPPGGHIQVNDAEEVMSELGSRVRK